MKYQLLLLGRGFYSKPMSLPGERFFLTQPSFWQWGTRTVVCGACLRSHCCTLTFLSTRCKQHAIQMGQDVLFRDGRGGWDGMDITYGVQNATHILPGADQENSLWRHVSSSCFVMIREGAFRRWSPESTSPSIFVAGAFEQARSHLPQGRPRRSVPRSGSTGLTVHSFGNCPCSPVWRLGYFTFSSWLLC